MKWIALVAFVLFCLGVLESIRRDCPELYARARRVVGGLLFAVALAVVIQAIFIVWYGCNDFEPYSALWYLYLCMGHSS